MNPNTNQITDFANQICPKKLLSIDFDKDFYKELDQKNFYQKNTKIKNRNILKTELAIVRKTSKLGQMIVMLNQIPSFILGQIATFANFLTTIPPFANILEIASFLTKSRDF